MNKTEIGIVSKKFSLIKIAIDMHLRNYRVVRQIESSGAQPAQKFAPEGFYGGWRSNGVWPSGWWSVTRRAALGMSRRAEWRRWGWRSR